MSSVSEQVPGLPRKGASLSLLIFAMVVTLSAFAQVGLARDGSLPSGLFIYGTGLAVLGGVAYVVVARFTPYADPVLLPLAVALNGIGLAMIYRLDLDLSRDKIRAIAAGKKLAQDEASAPQQLQWTFVAIVLFVLVILLLRDIKIFQRYMYTLGGLGLFFLALPGLLPSSISGALGAKIWIRIGPFSIQPGEFAKILLIAFFAGYLVNKRQALSLVGKKVGFISLPRARDLMPIIVIWMITLAVLVLEKDLGTALLFFGLFVSMLYIATQRSSWVFIGLLLFAGAAYLATLLPFLGHVNQRIEIWLDPRNPAYVKSGLSDQLLRGLFSLGQGGVLGTGLGQGQPWRTPLSFSDFIITSLGEELGLTGMMVILLLYLLIVQRGMKTALAARDPFLKLFAGGVSFVIALQVFVIVGGVTRLIPLTGLTTPFLSQGGSSLLANWIIIAILIRMSHDARKPAPQAIQDEGMTQVVMTP
ncbi:MAG: cell cycle protein [Streptosporangiaceae bacterium]|jgi:cell division protein FtsW (lipid II flippase)|nr:cell cycle protein [Streptosporangiaceae bacterium]